MKFKLIIVCLFGVLLTSCESRENQELRTTIDSLQMEIQERDAAQQLLSQMGTLLDSIDASRNLMPANMIKAEPDNSYVIRLRNINRYIKEMEGKMYQMEQSRQRARIRSSVEGPGGLLHEEDNIVYSHHPDNIQHTLAVRGN